MSIVVGNAEVCGKLRIHPRDIVVGNAEGCERILVHPRDIKEKKRKLVEMMESRNSLANHIDALSIKIDSACCKIPKATISVLESTHEMDFDGANILAKTAEDVKVCTTLKRTLYSLRADLITQKELAGYMTRLLHDTSIQQRVTTFPLSLSCCLIDCPIMHSGCISRL